MITQDTLKYLNRGSNFYTNQEALSFQNLFRGIVIKHWIQLNENTNYFKYNKILVHKYIIYYHTC